MRDTRIKRKAEDIAGSLDGRAGAVCLGRLYGSREGTIAAQTERLKRLLKAFTERFPDACHVEIFSTPGRTEVGGNHTDHNGGRVLAGAVDLDVLAAVTPAEDGIIVVKSEGFPEDRVDTTELEPVEAEKYTSSALIRGICARLVQLGFEVGGFRAVTTSNVLKGSGLSSSAAYEVLICSILSHLYNESKLDPVLIAQIAQYSENKYFGKPCGLMDQIACSVGGLVTIDFRDFEKPIVKKVGFNFQESGYSVVIIDTGGDHANLNEDYAELAGDMKQVAGALGGKVLRDCTKEAVLGNIAALREKTSDRAVLRALHFFDDSLRVEQEVAALEKGDFDDFLRLVTESGRSSWMLCQNCYSSRDTRRQGIPLALEASRNLLAGKGALRVHGGGFAGTIQVFLPDDMAEGYIKEMEAIFGKGACHRLAIRQEGTVRLEF